MNHKKKFAIACSALLFLAGCQIPTTTVSEVDVVASVDKPTMISYKIPESDIPVVLRAMEAKGEITPKKSSPSTIETDEEKAKREALEKPISVEEIIEKGTGELPDQKLKEVCLKINEKSELATEAVDKKVTRSCVVKGVELEDSTLTVDRQGNASVDELVAQIFGEFLQNKELDKFDIVSSIRSQFYALKTGTNGNKVTLTVKSGIGTLSPELKAVARDVNDTQFSVYLTGEKTENTAPLRGMTLSGVGAIKEEPKEPKQIETQKEEVKEEPEGGTMNILPISIGVSALAIFGIIGVIVSAIKKGKKKDEEENAEQQSPSAQSQFPPVVNHQQGLESQQQWGQQNWDSHESPRLDEMLGSKPRFDASIDEVRLDPWEEKDSGFRW